MRNKLCILAGLALILVLLIGCVKQVEPDNQPEGLSGYKVNYSREYPVSNADVPGFEMKKTGFGFTVYYHAGNDINANKVLAVLEQAGLDLYKNYLGLEPKGIQVYIAATADEYVRIADFPGGKENVAVGDGSAPNGKIYLYRPFEETIPGKTEGMIIHEGVHAVVYQFLGKDKIQYLPGFLNEGLAYYIEFVFKAGPKFDPLDQIYHSDLLINGIKTGNPKLLSLEELAQKCDGYISEDTLNFLCRSQGTYIVWYINENYGEGALEKFLTDLKQTQDWQKALGNLTGNTTSQSGQEIQDNLKSMVEQKKR